MRTAWHIMALDQPSLDRFQYHMYTNVIFRVLGMGGCLACETSSNTMARFSSKLLWHWINLIVGTKLPTVCFTANVLQAAQLWLQLAWQHKLGKLQLLCWFVLSTISSHKDPLVSQAALEQYRSRSAYKLIELDDKYHFLTKGSVVVRECGFTKP